MTEFFVRSYPLEDIKITKGGDGRTVEAYAAVFKRSAEIRDQDGHYLEDIDPTAFNRTIQHRGNKFGVFYNHGLTIHGTPSDRGSVPIGTPQEVRVDNVGVRTVTRYNRTALAEEVLESINSGAITAQSFTGRFLRSNPVRVPRKGKAGGLPTVTRMEIDMREYGPTPFPAYAEAMITGVRAALAGRWSDGEQSPDMDDDLMVFMARRSGVPVGVLREFIHAQNEGTRGALSIGSLAVTDDRDTLSADELSSSIGDDTPPVDSSRQDTPPVADSSSGDPAPKGGHSDRLRIARIARKIKLSDHPEVGNARTEEKRGSQGDSGGVQD